MNQLFLKKSRNILLICIVLFVNLSIFGQEKVAKGIVIDKNSNQFIEGAMVNIEGTDVIVYTDESGEFIIEIPQRRRYLLVSEDGYKTAKTALKPGFQHKTPNIYLVPLAVNDSTFTYIKNAVTLSLFEIFNGAIALRYERFLKQKHSIGIHGSFYLFGRNPTALGSEHDHYVKYQGIKASPFYRYYLIRKRSFGLFGEGKIQMGYFDFSELGYYYGSGMSQYKVYSEQSFWTVGIGVSVGIKFKLPKKGVGNLSIGYQYFPIHVPETFETPGPGGNTMTYTVDTDWWYRGGPGSYVDVKFTLGIGW